MRRIDLSIEIDESRWSEALGKRKMSAFGHVGTHLDVMNKEFPLENSVLKGSIINVSSVRGKDIEIVDADLSHIVEGDFVLFYSGFLKETGYGTELYSKNHPQLSQDLVRSLVENRVRMIGIDAAGIRRGTEHAPADQYCADNGVFVVENLANLDVLCSLAGKRRFTVYTFPLLLKGATGLPCRVVAEVDS
jgi:kynurenine formamidase